MNHIKRQLSVITLALMLVFTGCAFNVSDSYAATIVPFWQTKAAVSKTYVSNFTLQNPVTQYDEVTGEPIEDTTDSEMVLDGAYSESGAKAFNKTGDANKTEAFVKKCDCTNGVWQFVKKQSAE